MCVCVCVCMGVGEKDEMREKKGERCKRREKHKESGGDGNA